MFGLKSSSAAFLIAIVSLLLMNLLIAILTSAYDRARTRGAALQQGGGGLDRARQRAGGLAGCDEGDFGVGKISRPVPHRIRERASARDRKRQIGEEALGALATAREAQRALDATASVEESRQALMNLRDIAGRLEPAVRAA